MKFQPHAYQAEAIRRIEEHPRYALFLDMGLGKTVVTLTAIQDLIYDRAAVSRVLIVAPRSVAEATWQDEAEKWEHLYLTFSTVLGTRTQREAALGRKADCYVVNRENVVWLCEHYRYELPFDMLVIDESSSFKNPRAKRFRALRKALPGFSRVVLLTGTPAPNTLMDLWAQMYLLDRGAALGRTLTAYRLRYFLPDKTNGPMVYSYKLRSPAAEKEIYARIASEVMSLKAADYLKLPRRMDNFVRVTLPARARETYRKLEKELVLSFDAAEVTATSAAALSNKLLQLANGRVYTDTHGVVDVHDAKIAALSEIKSANEGKPLLVFYAYQHDREKLLANFREAVLLRGADEVRAWNAGEVPLLLAHPASTAYGLNLQAGGHIIVWYGLTWSLELYEQANARLYRQGQQMPVMVHHLVAAGTMDEQVMRALKRKAAGQEALLAAVRAKIGEYGGGRHGRMES